MTEEYLMYMHEQIGHSIGINMWKLLSHYVTTFFTLYYHSSTVFIFYFCIVIFLNFFFILPFFYIFTSYCHSSTFLLHIAILLHFYFILPFFHIFTSYCHSSTFLLHIVIHLHLLYKTCYTLLVATSKYYTIVGSYATYSWQLFMKVWCSYNRCCTIFSTCWHKRESV